MVKIVIADDHPIVQQGIRMILDGLPEFNIVGFANNGEEAIALVIEKQPDILILDIEMPGKNGIDVIKEINEKKIPVRILVISAHNNAYYISEVLKNGAQGYLLKEDAPDQIVNAIRGVSSGQQGWVSRPIAQELMLLLEMEKSNTFQTEIPNLTKREYIALQGIVAGKTDKEIAFSLGIAEKTLWRYMNSLFHKLNVSTRVEAAVHAIRQGWL